MEHVFFARFPSEPAARKVLADLTALDPNLVVDLVPADVNETSQDMPPSVSNVPAAIAKGVLGGGAGGLLLGLALAEWGGVGAMPATAGLAALGGALAGALGAGLTGAQNPDQNLEKAAARLREGEVLLCIRAPDLSLEERALDVVHDAGGEVVPRAGIKPIDDMEMAADREHR